jgi:hypothetical protein
MDMRTMTSGRRILFRTAGLGLMLAVSCAMAACGGSGKSQDGIASGGGGTGAAASASPSASGGGPAQWTKCLRDNGIDVKDPDPSTGAVDLPSDSPALTAALGKCKQYNSGTSGSTGLNPSDPKQADQRRKFAKCMRDQGVDWPDPVAGEPMTVPAQTPAMMAAFQKCSQEVPMGGGK